MAIEQRIYNIGICKAAADLKAKQFYIAKVTAAMTVGLNSVAGEACLGIIQNKPDIGEAVDLTVIGISKVKVGVGGIAAGALYEGGGDGRAITCAAAKNSLGVCLVAAAENELATVTVGCGTGATIAA